MTTTKAWDAKFLNDRERRAREAAAWSLAQADWKRAVAEVERAKSDMRRCYRSCRNAACRRARHCVREVPNCLIQTSTETSLPWIDGVYVRLQIARREAAKAGKQKGG